MKASVCIVTFSLSEAGHMPLSNLARLISRLANRVYVVSGGAAMENFRVDSNVQVLQFTHRYSSRLLLRIINYVHTQVKILNRVIEASRQTNLFVFFIGGENLILPMLTLKLLRKKVLLMPAGITTKGYRARKDSLFRFSSLLASFNSSLADKIVLYSGIMIREANLTRYQSKIIVGHEHFVDFSKFFTRRTVDERLNVVGYIGRLSEEKGILSLINAIPFVLKKNIEIHFMICGDGSLTDMVRRSLQSVGLKANTEFTNWITHDEVPRYLNEFRLLILPSSTEGLPNILLEAMSCGTPVLATSVGAIPDIIKDNETGFLLTSNAPEHIASRIVELLGEPEILEKVSIKAHNWVRENFSEKETTETWQEILNRIDVS
jgi:glycosyltransferase involved in cell wall biosynthesis